MNKSFKLAIVVILCSLSGYVGGIYGAKNAIAASEKARADDLTAVRSDLAHIGSSISETSKNLERILSEIKTLQKNSEAGGAEMAEVIFELEDGEEFPSQDDGLTQELRKIPGVLEINFDATSNTIEVLFASSDKDEEMIKKVSSVFKKYYGLDDAASLHL